MKKEFIATGILGLVIFGYVLDFVAGPVRLGISSPFAFFSPTVLAQFPFTAVSIAIKTASLCGLILLAFSFVSQKFLTKSAVLVCVAALLILYSIQQIASGAMLLLPIQWLLAFTATGIVLILPTILFFLIGIFHTAYNKFQRKNTELSP